MNVLYGFALVVGGGMFLFSLAADLFGGGDVDAGGGLDVNADVDASLDGGADAAGDHAADGAHADSAFRILSLRNATYFLFAFGVSGVLLTWLWGGERALLTAAFAATLGVVGGAISTFAFGWMRRTETGYLADDRGWIGHTGVVTIPLSAGGTGKVLVVRDGREHELLARPFERAADRPERWTRVMVIEMRQGVALVSPGDPALESTEVKSLGPTTES